MTGVGVRSGGAGSQGAGLVQVRVDAVAALRSLVDAFHEDDLPSIKPLIPSLLNQLFALMAEVRSSLWTLHPAPLQRNPCQSAGLSLQAYTFPHQELLLSMQLVMCTFP